MMTPWTLLLGGQLALAGGHTLYPDADLDGFGEAGAAPITSAELVEGYASNDQDCDDTDPTVNPAADEICDQRDQDCDGQIDEPILDPDQSGCAEVFRDLDEDGYGDPNVSECLCLYGDEGATINPNTGESFVVDSSDCDDLDGTAHEDCAEDTAAPDDGGDDTGASAEAGASDTGGDDPAEEDKASCAVVSGTGSAAALALTVLLGLRRRRALSPRGR